MRKTPPRAGLVLSALALTAACTLAFAATASARAWLGVVSQEINGELREGMNLPGESGVLVNRVLEDSPAERAGLRQGDVILRFNSRAVESPEALQGLVGDAREGQEVALEIARHGERRTLSAKLGTRPDQVARVEAPDTPEPPESPEPPSRAPRAGDDHGNSRIRVRILGDGSAPKVYDFEGDDTQAMDHARELLRRLPRGHGGGLEGLGDLGMMMGVGRGRLGVRVQSLNADLAAALGAPGKEGVLVLEVLDDTPASRAGLRSGDVILAVKDDGVTDAEDLVKSLRDVSGKVSLSVWRKGERRTVEAELGPAPRMGRDDGAMMWHGRMGGPDPEHPRVREDSGTDDLHQQVEELRQQLRELRKQLEGMHHE